MVNTSAALSVSFVALSRLAGDHDATGIGCAAQGTGLSLTSRWTGVAVPAAGSQDMRRVHSTPDNYTDVDIAAPNAAAVAKQGAPPRGAR